MKFFWFEYDDGRVEVRMTFAGRDVGELRLSTDEFVELTKRTPEYLRREDPTSVLIPITFIHGT